MEFDHSAFLDAEVLLAPRTPTANLYHYTNADAAIFGILKSGQLRMSPFESTNDLWESKPGHPTIQAHEDDIAVDPGVDLWESIDREIRLRVKVACFTQEWSLPDHVGDQHAFAGWNHLSAWAHYGNAHAGVCLRFDRAKLINALAQSADLASATFHGPVVYRASGWGSVGEALDIGQIREFGLDAVAARYIEKHHRGLLFEKHRDWENESEYRLIGLHQSRLPVELDIREALTGLILGERFPDNRLPALHEVLALHPGLPVYRSYFHNRHPHIAEQPAETERLATGPWGAARREGSLADRAAMLRSAELEAEKLRAEGLEATAHLARTIRDDVDKLPSVSGFVDGVSLRALSSARAVPTAYRRRAPGVVGERVHFETGQMLIARDARVSESAHPPELIAAAALQLLDGDIVRLHAMVDIEDLSSSPNHITELWRASSEVDLLSGESKWSELASGLRAAVVAATAVLDAARNA
ncbi:DUF2971 domain-containing protein [Microbacterium sp. Root180]|uniref:DUF2971 domain-containing protein n=1 Tax=Microbacterium sp. Root180 TaxID=1736483 RepID=UPI0009E6B724|nr:DUF2971 domain-containing protein [Microbacterium sp. Root180]